MAHERLEAGTKRAALSHPLARGLDQQLVTLVEALLDQVVFEPGRRRELELDGLWRRLLGLLLVDVRPVHDGRSAQHGEGECARVRCATSYSMEKSARARLTTAPEAW